MGGKRGGAQGRWTQRRVRGKEGREGREAEGGGVTW